MEKHQRVDTLLQIEQRRRWGDPFRIMRLKKLKLRIKDLIHRLTSRSKRRPHHAMP
jgi:uncharacterized protein YdcH (DUF465 family)